MSGRRLLRVAELLQADAESVRAAVTALPRRIRAEVGAVPAGMLLTLEYRGPWWQVRPRRIVLAQLERLLQDIAGRTTRLTVVGAAIRRNGLVLAAQRSHPAALAGKWEFPGGKVELGETTAAALVRECLEELGVAVTVGSEVGRASLAGGAQLIVLWAELSDPDSEPQSLEHAEIRWCEPAELGSLDWLESNRALAQRAVVAGRSPLL